MNIVSKACIGFLLFITLVLVPGFTGTCAGSGGPVFIQLHFTNPICSINSSQLHDILSGKTNNFAELGGENQNIHFYTDETIAKAIKNKFPRLNCKVTDFSSNRQLMLDRHFLGLSDIRKLQPCFKTLYINDTLPWGHIRKDYSLEDNTHYSFYLKKAEKWNADLLLIVVQTGVTAMARAFRNVVDREKDLDYPISYIKNITRQADVAMTSNEVSFVEPCPSPLKDRLSFCSPLRYFSILEKLGMDVIELTGNHNNDFGRRYNLHTMEMIEKAGMIYFGGGKNKQDSEKIRYLTIKDRQLAFVGFNEIGPEPAFSSDKGAGAARYSSRLFRKLIEEAGRNADIVFVSVQCWNENDPKPWPSQKRLLRRAADLGATITISSSAHRAMGIEFYKGKFISYGPGNFLFDQMQTINHRRGYILRHYFYGRKHIQTELLPYLIHHHCRPIPVRDKDAGDLFHYVYSHSQGPVFTKSK